MESLEDMFDRLNVKASKTDIRRWQNNNDFGKHISFVEFLHYSRIFNDDDGSDFMPDNTGSGGRSDPSNWREERWVKS